jgi:hypothetical protein
VAILNSLYTSSSGWPDIVAVTKQTQGWTTAPQIKEIQTAHDEASAQLFAPNCCVAT